MSVNDKLKSARNKAQKILDTLQDPRNDVTPNSTSNRLWSPATRTPGLNKTDYVSYKRLDSINISDLAEENTIEIPPCSPAPPQPGVHISFEPSEITGRSTMLTSKKYSLNYRPSVEEILAGSSYEDVRIMGDSLRSSVGNGEGGYSAAPTVPQMSKDSARFSKNVPSVDEILASSFCENVRSYRDSLRESQSGASCPRTEDMSSFSKDSLFSSNGGCNFSGIAGKQNESGFMGESFTPAEKMNSKLAADELAWDREYATIPEASQFSTTDKQTSKNGAMRDSFSFGASMENEFSIGQFFRGRSENLFEMISKISPTKTEPYPLIDETDLNSTARTNDLPERDTNPVTPKIDDKTYDKTYRSSLRTAALNNQTGTGLKGNKESVDSVLSVSDIARALDTFGSPETFVNKLMAKKVKSSVDPPAEPLADITHSIKALSLSPLKFKKNLNERRFQKENIDPEPMATTALSDTLSFSESLFNTLDYKKNDQRELFKMPVSSPSKHSKKWPQAKVAASMSDEENLLKVPTPKPRKRSHSATRSNTKMNNSNDHPSKSPVNMALATHSTSSGPEASPRRLLHVETTNVSTTSTSSPLSSPSNARLRISKSQSPSLEAMSTFDRMFRVDSKSPVDSGKFSLPNYGLARPGDSRCLSPSHMSKFRCNSQLSTASSEFSHRDGKLPLKSTVLELSWGSVKLRKSVKQTFQIKNTSHKRLVIRIEISGPGFQMLSAADQGSRLTLQAQECRTMVLSFCPTVIGVAVGRLTFHPPFENAAAQQTIALFGYGGHALVLLQGIQKGLVGSPFLTMGELCELTKPLEKTFTLYNKGPLAAFACILVDSIGLDNSRLCESVEIIPKKVLIMPESTVEVKVVFRPRRDDIKKILKKVASVMGIANLRIICGDEPTRQRVRNLIKKINNEASKLTSSSLTQVWSEFPKENEITGLELLKEKSDVAMDLMSTLSTYQVSITLNHTNINDTGASTVLFPDIDETVMFRTFTSDASMMEVPEDEEKTGSDRMSNILSKRRTSGESWSVRPNFIEINPFDKKTLKSIITIRSNFFAKQYFDLDTNFRHLFCFNPKEGQLRPGEEVHIEVLFKPFTCLPSEEIFVVVYLENERIRIPIKICQDSLPQHLK